MANLLSTAVDDAVWGGVDPLQASLGPRLDEAKKRQDAVIESVKPAPVSQNTPPPQPMPPSGGREAKGFSAGPSWQETTSTTRPSRPLAGGRITSFKSETTTAPVDRLKMMYGGDWTARIDEARKQGVPDEVTEQSLAAKEAEMLDADIDQLTIDAVFGRTPEMRKQLHGQYNLQTAEKLAKANNIPLEEAQETIAVAKIFNVAPSVVFNYPDIKENLTGKMKAQGIKVDKSLWDGMNDAWASDEFSIERNRLRARSMFERRDNTPEEKNQIDALDKELAQLGPQALDDNSAYGLFERGATGFTGLLAQLYHGVEQFTDTPGWRTVIGKEGRQQKYSNIASGDGLMAKVVNLGLNNPVGDQLIRESVGIYDELEGDTMPDGSPLPQELRSVMSMVGGGISGLVGAAQIGTIVGGATRPLGGTAARGAITSAIKSRTFKKMFTSALAEAGIDYTKEVGEEVAQRVITIGARELARYMGGSTTQAGVSEIADELFEEGTEAALSMAGFLGWGALKGAAQSRAASSQVASRRLDIDRRGAHRDAQQVLRGQAAGQTGPSDSLNQQMQDQANAGIDFEAPLNFMSPERKRAEVADIAEESGISPDEIVEAAEAHDLNNAVAASDGEDLMTENARPIDPNDNDSFVFIPHVSLKRALETALFQDVAPDGDADVDGQTEQRLRAAGVSEEGIQEIAESASDPDGDIALSEADYAKVRTVIGEEASEGLHQELYGAKEYVTAEERLAQIGNERAKRAIDPLSGESPAAVSARAIQANTMQQMISAGARKTEAEALSKLWATHLLTMSEMTGIAPEEMSSLIVRKANAEERGTFPGKSGMFFLDDPNSVIALFKAKDHSTLTHELGHAIFQNVTAVYDQSSPEFQRQWQEMAQWLGVKPGQSALTEAQSEKFANGFTKYVYSGKAPSKGLERIFSTLAKWIKRFLRVGDASRDIELSDAAASFYNALLSTKLEADGISGFSSDLGAIETDMEGAAIEARTLERKNEELARIAEELALSEEELGILLAAERESVDANASKELDAEEARLEVRISRQVERAYKDKGQQELIKRELEVNSLLRRVDKEREKAVSRAEKAERSVEVAGVKAQNVKQGRDLADFNRKIDQDILEITLRKRAIDKIDELRQKNKDRIAELRKRYKERATAKKDKEKESARQKKIVQRVSDMTSEKNRSKITVEARRELDQLFGGIEPLRTSENTKERRAAIRRMLATGQTTFDTLQARLDAEKAAQTAARDAGVRYRKEPQSVLPGLTQADLDYLYDINMFSLPLEQQQSIMADAESIYEWGQAQLKAASQAVRNSAQAKADKIAAGMGGYVKTGRRPNKAYDKDKVPFFVPAEWRNRYIAARDKGIDVKSILRSFLTPGRVFDMIDGGKVKNDGPMHKQMIEDRNRHMGKAIQGWRIRIGEPLERLMKDNDIDFTKLSQEMNLGQLPPVENVFGPGFQNPTWHQAIGLAVYEWTGLDMRNVIEGNFGAKTPAEIQAAEAYIAQVLQVLRSDPSAMAIMNYMLEDMNNLDTHARLSRVAEDVLNLDLGKVERYFPRKFTDKVESEEAEGHVEAGGSRFMKWEPGFTKDRLPNTNPRPMRLDVLSVWLSTVKEQEIWANMAQWHRDSIAMLAAKSKDGTATLAETIRENFGAETMSLIESELNDYISSQPLQSDEALSNFSKAMNILMKNTAMKALCFRVGPYLKNFINPARCLLSSMHLGNMLPTAVDVLTHWDDVMAAVDLRDPFIADRDAAYVSAQLQKSNMVGGRYSRLLNVGMGAMSHADQLVATFLDEMYFRGYVQNGMDPETAALRATADVQALQQPANKRELPLFWRQSNSVMRWLMQFTTEQAIQHGIVFYDLVQSAKQAVSQRDGEAANKVGRILMTIFLETTIMNLIVRGMPDDDDDESWVEWYAKGFAGYVFGAVPLVGSQFLSALYNEKSFGDAFLASIPLSQLVGGVYKIVGGSSSKMTSQGYSETEQGAWMVADAFSYIVPFPYEAIRGARKTFYADDMEGNTFVNMLAIMINSQYAAKKIKAMAKEQNKQNKRAGLYPKGER